MKLYFASAACIHGGTSAVSGFIKSKWLIIYLRSRAQTLLLQRLTTI